MDSIQITNIPDEIRKRQKSLISPFNNTSIIIAGIGGVGAWVALFAALVGIKQIYIFDDDVIEFSNLNRTPFRLTDVGKYKITAIEELIRERRLDSVIISYPRKIEISDIKKFWKVNAIFDCTDTSKFKEALREAMNSPEWMTKMVADGTPFSRFIKLGYDKTITTISTSLDGGKFGEDNSYSETPSYLCPPVYLAVMGIQMVIFGKQFNGELQTIDLNRVPYALEEFQSTRRARGERTYDHG